MFFLRKDGAEVTSTCTECTVLHLTQLFSYVRDTILTINQTVDYMARGFMSYMRGVDIGRVGLKVVPVLGPEIDLGPKQARLSNQPFQWPK